jgi:hypothetical protein
LAEYVGRYLAEALLTSVPGARWVLVEGRPDLMDYHHPAILASGLDYLPVIGTGVVQLKRPFDVVRPELDALERVLKNLRHHGEKEDR